MKIATPRLRRGHEALRLPEALRDQVNDPVLDLERPGHAQEARGLDEHHILLEDPAPDHYVHERRLVFQGHADHPPMRSRALSADDKPRVSDGKFRQPQTATRIARATAGPGFAPEKPTMIRNSSTPPRPVPSRASLQPFLDMRFEIVEVLKVLQVLVDQIPVDADIVMDQYVSKPS